nr:immunoglobulin light chain junction region [Macaca mulatta]MOX33269.1 immunoglobulin light chain junction region [Macaca mulatta]MOX33314.1 immunoglobulin light chain junction region [Macaca mulatta]MOX33330.1 immunoglobulin light chain junction region [Macaca mulatta]MOX33346.1 immunoglobulin light chain junction region [Macaca mulatta]
DYYCCSYTGSYNFG